MNGKFRFPCKEHIIPLQYIYMCILQRKEDSVKHISALLQLLLTISPSTAACEKLFSKMNLVKSPLRTRLTQENLQSQMSIVSSGPEFSEFDPLPSVEEWLKSGHRYICHKPPERSATVTSENIASTSALASSEMESIQTGLPMLTEIVKTLGGEDVARDKLCPNVNGMSLTESSIIWHGIIILCPKTTN